MAAWSERFWACQASAQRLRPERPKAWARTCGRRCPGKVPGAPRAGLFGGTKGLKGLGPAGPGVGIPPVDRKFVCTTPMGAGSAVMVIPPMTAWPGMELLVIIGLPSKGLPEGREVIIVPGPVTYIGAPTTAWPAGV